MILYKVVRVGFLEKVTEQTEEVGEAGHDTAI